MALFGYDVKEEAQEIKTELIDSRNQFILLGVATFVGGLGAYVIGTSNVVKRLKNWYEDRYDKEEE
jgi:hypothetical protein